MALHHEMGLNARIPEAGYGKLTAATVTGHSDLLGTTLSVIAPDADNNPIDPIFSDTALSVGSTSANDAAAGTGARTVLVSGLDAAGAALTESFTMNGQTKVTGSEVFSAVNGVIVLTAGSGGQNAGVVYVAATGDTYTAGVPAAPYSAIEAGFNMARVAAYTVPAGFKHLNTRFTFVGTAVKPLIVQLRFYSASAGLWYTPVPVDVDPSISIPAEASTAVAAGDTLAVWAKTASGNGAGFATIHGFLVPA